MSPFTAVVFAVAFIVAFASGFVACPTGRRCRGHHRHRYRPSHRSEVLMTTPIEWEASEWSDEEEATYFGGLEGVVVLTPDEEDGTYRWFVKATAEVSEWPELVSAGSSRTVAAARRKAEASLRKWAKRYTKVNY